MNDFFEIRLNSTNWRLQSNIYKLLSRICNHCPALIGKVKMNSVPLPSLLEKLMSPPCLLMIFFKSPDAQDITADSGS